MSTSQTIIVNGTATQTSAVNSTKVRVAAQVPFFYAVGTNPTANPAFSNTRLVPLAGVTSINMEGYDNKLSLLSAGTSGNVSITQVG